MRQLQLPTAQESYHGSEQFSQAAATAEQEQQLAYIPTSQATWHDRSSRRKQNWLRKLLPILTTMIVLVSTNERSFAMAASFSHSTSGSDAIDSLTDQDKRQQRLERSSAFYDQTESEERRKQNSLDNLLESQWYQRMFGSTDDPKEIRSDSSEAVSSFVDADQIAEFEQKENHPMVGVPTLPKEEEGEPWYNTIEIGYAWIFGFRPYLFWSNTTECFDHMTNLTYHEMPEYRNFMGNPDNSDYDKTTTTFYLIQNITVHVWHCTSAWQTMNWYWYQKWQTFDSVGHFFLSLLQNILGEVISLTNLYRALEENVKAKNTYLVHYDTARLVRVLAIFDPIELQDDDLIYNQGDADTIPDPDVNEAKQVVGGQQNGLLVKLVRYLSDRQSLLAAQTKKEKKPSQQKVQEKDPFGGFADDYNEAKQQPYKRQRSSGINESSSGPRVRAGPFSNLEGKERGYWSDFSGWQEVANVFLGFTNATQFIFGDNRTECQFAIEALIYSSQDATDIMTRAWFSYFDFWLALDEYLVITYNLYTLQYSCTESIFEIKDLAIAYWSWTQDGSKIAFNTIYNAGLIIKGVTNIFMYFIAKDYTRVADGFSLGMEFGQLFWLIFYPAQEYLEETLAEGGVWGQDYTWDAVIALQIPDEDGYQLAPVIGTPSETQIFGPEENQQVIEPTSKS